MQGKRRLQSEWEEDAVCYDKFDTLLRNAVQQRLDTRQQNLAYWASVGQWLVDLSQTYAVWVPQFITSHPDDYYQYIEDNWEQDQ